MADPDARSRLKFLLRNLISLSATIFTKWGVINSQSIYLLGLLWVFEGSMSGGHRPHLLHGGIVQRVDSLARSFYNISCKP